MQTNNNNPNKVRTNIPSKSYTNNNVKEPEQPRTELSNLFKPPSDPVEAQIERAKLHGRQTQNTNKSADFLG